MQSACYLCHILVKLGFSRQFFEKNTQISNSMKVRRVEADSQYEANSNFAVLGTRQNALNM